MIGKMLGDRYELLEKIGEGGMAVVYKAKCHYLNRFVAIKILKDQFCNDKEFVEKFKREATSVASLGDNNIVNIYDVGSEEDIHYIVMEYVKGKTLKELIDEKGKLNNNEALSLSIQIANALVCAHKNNIVHRDIKPHNILLTEENIVKVTDFGIAKASGSATITNSSKVMGSAHYFSPEQAKGSFVDFKTDIYSLGIVMYEMLTGKVPFDAESAVSVALKHIQDAPTAPKDLNKDIPDSLNNLILKCLEKDPIRRYQSVKELSEDLTKIKNNEDVNINNMMENDMTRVLDTDLVNDKLKEDSDLEDEDDFEEDEEDFEEKPKRKRSKKINNKLIIGAIAVLVIVIGSVAAFFSFGKSDAGDKVEVPNIVGMTKEDAEKALKEKNLKLTVAQKVKSDKKEGTIVESYPPSGTKVKKDSEVRVSISGGKILTVPDLKGMDLQSAKDLINNSDLKVGDVSREYSDSVPEGNIISQSLNTGEEVKEGTKIDLVVSRGENLEEKRRQQREAEKQRKREEEAQRKAQEAQRKAQEEAQRKAEEQRRAEEQQKPDPQPKPDKPEPDKPEPDKPEPDKPEPDKPQPDNPDPSQPTNGSGSGSGQNNSN
ncbi:Stk1 family PASTA domain-containing Ser/Thr kinase [Clostridium oceanicum]|uniref:non-specific serine/threonine protein kinase n=1 Tax=Clostridium oceanicum TaxID=1543 RepID=A0ABN1JBA3_9CLOT